MGLARIAGFHTTTDGVDWFCEPIYVDATMMTAVDAPRGPAQVRAEANLPLPADPGFAIARLAGDLDIATTPALRERLLSVFRPGLRLLIIELSGVSFCDVSALAVLVCTRRRARRLGVTVRLAAPRPQMTKLLSITGLDGHFTVCATLDDALPMRSGGRLTAVS
jgi:anti-anti-sigma factor